jgi:hypothetical protein
MAGISETFRPAIVAGAAAIMVMHIRSLGVFYTSSSDSFIGRHFGDPQGSFFKQAELLNVPDFTPVEIETLAHSRLGEFISSAVRAQIIRAAGLRAADVNVFLNLLAALPRAAARQGKPINVDDVWDAAATLVQERSATYTPLVRSQISPAQRAMLAAFARGTELRATREMAAASGVHVGSLRSAIRLLIGSGWAIETANNVIFADPFLRLHLALDRNTD